MKRQDFEPMHIMTILEIKHLIDEIVQKDIMLNVEAKVSHLEKLCYGNDIVERIKRHMFLSFGNKMYELHGSKVNEREADDEAYTHYDASVVVLEVQDFEFLIEMLNKFVK